jgi:hypothetical protein
MLRSCFFVLVFFVFPVHAQILEGPISSALGGSGRAGIDGNEGVFLNPALVAMMPGASGDLYYKDGDRDINQHTHYYGASLSENTEESLMAGSLSYFRMRNTGVASTPLNSEVWNLTFGQMFWKRWAVGISGYRVSQNPESQAAFQLWNGSLGTVFLIDPTFGIAYVFENPIGAGSKVPVPLRLLPRQSAGLFYLTPYKLRLRADVIRQEQFNPNKKIDVRLGSEMELQDYFLFRLGARLDELENQRFITAGFCLFTAKLKIDYSFEKNIARTNGAVHSVDLRSTF